MADRTTRVCFERSSSPQGRNGHVGSDGGRPPAAESLKSGHPDARPTRGQASPRAAIDAAPPDRFPQRAKALFFADPGDFNQFMPRVWGPKRSHQLMEEAFAGYSIVTSGEIQGVGARAIDHVAFAGNLHATRVSGRPAAQGDGRKRSDHFGVIVDCPAPLSGGGRKNAQRLPGTIWHSAAFHL